MNSSAPCTAAAATNNPTHQRCGGRSEAPIPGADSTPAIDVAAADTAAAEEGVPAEAAGTDDSPPEPPAELGSPRQLILIYSGDTLARAAANLDVSPPEGGLCALAATIADSARRRWQSSEQWSASW